MANATSTTTTCGACLNVFAKTETHDFGGSRYCFPCLHDCMDLLIQSENGYPCTINGNELDPGMFTAHDFGGTEAHEKFKHRFDMKKQEWETPGELRLFCDCDKAMFIGSLVRDTTGHETTYPGCGSCFQLWCMKCASKIDETSDDDVIQPSTQKPPGEPQRRTRRWLG